jgi:hypothetical protein
LTSMAWLWYCEKRFTTIQNTRMPPCVPGTGHRKKDDRNNENSELGAGKREHLYRVVTVLKASVILIASVFYFNEVSILDANEQFKERAISVITQGR